MSEVCKNAEEFISGLVEEAGFSVEVSSEFTEEGCVIDFAGDDAGIMLSENGELLDAFETILFQVYGRDLDREHRFVCDAEGFRKTRRSELQAMAKFAAKNVREKGVPFTFGVLNSTERRIIHLALSEEKDLETESVGQGRDRRLQVRLK